MREDNGALALDLGDGLRMRQATWQDAEELAAFNIRIHSDDPKDPEMWLGEWTKDLLRGDHPTTSAGDFTVVVDKAGGNKIVSSMVLIPQTWRYDGIPFAVGRPELVGTDEAYRRRGLVRRQMEVIHGWSRKRGHLVQAITGIPYYYRRFGYEMALDLGGSRLYPYDRLRQLKTSEHNGRRVRKATLADLPVLSQLYDRHCAASMVSRIRDKKEWRYEIQDAHESSEYRRDVYLLETVAGAKVLGYFECTEWGTRLAVREMAAFAGCSLRDIALETVRYLRDNKLEEADDKKDPPTLLFALGVDHPAYQALARELVPNREPYAWYLRVPDIPAFLRKIGPALEYRLQESVVAGYNGELKLNCTTEMISLAWEQGRLKTIDRSVPEKYDEGDAYFPGLTFLQLLFCYRDVDQLHHAHADCLVGKEETYVLLKALFPRRNSQPVGLG